MFRDTAEEHLAKINELVEDAHKLAKELFVASSDLDHYFEAQSEIIKVEFIQKFVEFGKARFYLDIIETT